MSQLLKAVIGFEDGTVYEGKGFGAKATTCGEAVFNTSMTGYGELLTDPSYYGQVIGLTVPHVGNYGICLEDEESDNIWARGLVVRDLSSCVSNWRADESLEGYMERHGVPGVSGIDTRAWTLKLREAGTLKVCISTEGISGEEAVKRAQGWEGLEGVDCAKIVTAKDTYTYKPKQEAKFTVEGTNLYETPSFEERVRIVAVDFGVKRSILNKLHWRGFEVTVVPVTATADEILNLNPEGVFLSNGPGDPQVPTYAHEMVGQLLGKVPVFGICMGHQVLAKAMGASTYKLKFGHRGGNQPVKNIETGKVSITAQNHGYAVDEASLTAAGGVVTEIHLNDNTVSGLRHKEHPAFSVQYHPEGGPGPNDAEHHFEAFKALIKKNSRAVARM